MGMAVAVSAVADVSYLAEVAPRGLRGAMVSTNELAISIGMLGAFLTGHLLRDTHGKGFNRTQNTSPSGSRPSSILLLLYYNRTVGLKARVNRRASYSSTLWHRQHCCGIVPGSG